MNMPISLSRIHTRVLGVNHVSHAGADMPALPSYWQGFNLLGRRRNVWKWTFRFFGRWYVTFSNVNVKIRRPSARDDVTKRAIIRRFKQVLYKRQGGVCAECGASLEGKPMEMHHILSVWRYPEYRHNIHNLMLLCPRCHQEIHNNPFRNAAMIEAKAAEFGVDLKQRYDHYHDRATE